MTNRDQPIPPRASFETARAIFDETLRAVDAGAAIRCLVRLEDSALKICDMTFNLCDKDASVYVIAIGKAAQGMAAALDGILGNRLAAGIASGALHELARDITSSSPSIFASKRWQVFSGGHPLPNEASLAAAHAAFTLMQQADKARAPVIFLVSGGGSAMIEWPIDDSVTLVDLREANKILVECGASITEINALRRGFSAVKGGKLAALAPHCDQVTLIVSDVPTGNEAAVASGPSLSPPADAPDVYEVLARHHLRSRLPQTVLRAIEHQHLQRSSAEPYRDSSEAQNAQVSDGDRSPVRRHILLLDNQSALEAAADAAQRRGFITEIAGDISDQSIAEGCSQLWQRLVQLLDRVAPAGDRRRESKTVCLVSGGEFACPVRGPGTGGRNLETALRLARSSASVPDMEPFVALCAGTDGIDGNSPAAGAVVDHTTLDRARAVGFDADECLIRSDSYSFFAALGDAITTGPTGTNVRDLRILLADLSSPNSSQG